MKNKPAKNAPEVRFFTTEVRALSTEGQATKIVGYGAVFDQRSENLGGFREIIKQGAFDEVLTQDVRGLFNHDSNYILGRTASGTMELTVDEQGLQYSIDPPNTATVRDMVLTPMERGDITQSSFTFIVARDGDRWYEDEEGIIIREISKVSRLLDVSPVSIPAYPDTTAASRGFDDYKNNQQALIDHEDGKIQKEKRSRELFLLK